MASSFSGVSQIIYVVLVCLSLISKVMLADTTTNMSDYAFFSSSLYPVASNNSSSSPAPQIKYDVFVSFRGKDIRQGFLSHLTKALSRKKIFAFVDEKLEKGDEISEALLEAIERSLISLIIFSPDYASSQWCLKELVKIIDCKVKYGQIVVPVFYKVDPSDVRHQKGTYGIAFAEHKKKYSRTTLKIWRSALNESANLSGFHSSNFRNDAYLIEEIIKWMTRRLNHVHLANSKGLVGINEQIAHFESILLHQGVEDVRVIGIWGMGGIGKTTIAEEVYNLLRVEYEESCFLANIRDTSKGHGIISLKNKLFSQLIGEKDLNIETPNGLPHYVERRLGRMKVLIVLDDVNDLEQLEILIGARAWFGKGTRIIITTRDKQVLAKEVDDIYEVEGLDFHQSLQLFNLIAFKQNHLEMDHYELSKKVVNYAKGIPLVLKVLGHLLRGKNKEIWESQLEKLKKMPIKKVYDVMRLSYDDLDRQEKKLFLDIACFFNFFIDGDLTVDWMKELLKDDDYSVAVGLERLQDKALIDISEDDTVSMHGMIRDMALEMVRQKTTKDTGNDIRLWDPDEVYQILRSNKGGEDIRSITVHLSVIKGLQLSPQVFAVMNKLQFMNFHSVNPQHRLFLPQGLQSLPSELRFLSWDHYPLKSLPKKFSAEKLVILDLRNSRVEKLWSGVKNLQNLKVVDLKFSEHLVELPEFSKAPNLEIMDLSYCARLTRVHPSIFSLDKLEVLDLSYSSIDSLPNDIHPTSLRYLNLNSCKRLEKFSISSDSLEEIDLAYTGITKFPSSIIGRLSKLEILNLEGSEIESLPTIMKHLTMLKVLDVSFSRLRNLPELPSSIQGLDCSDCISLKTVLFPSVVKQLKENKKTVRLWNCLNLDKHSLRDIGLNAQINLMKFAYQSIVFLEHNHVEDYIYDKAYKAKATYVYPGKQVPMWLVHRTTRSYKTIDLSSGPSSSPPFAFIFCFIISQVPSEGVRLRLSINIDNEDEDQRDQIVYLDRPELEITSDHVCLVYDQRWSRYLNNISKNQPRLKIKVIAVSLTKESEHVPVQLRGFGVSPVSASDYHNFIQQKMKLSDRTISLEKWKWVITRRAILSLTICFALQLGKNYFDIHKMSI